MSTVHEYEGVGGGLFSLLYLMLSIWYGWILRVCRSAHSTMFVFVARPTTEEGGTPPPPPPLISRLCFATIVLGLLNALSNEFVGPGQRRDGMSRFLHTTTKFVPGFIFQTLTYCLGTLLATNDYYSSNHVNHSHTTTDNYNSFRAFFSRRRIQWTIFLLIVVDCLVGVLVMVRLNVPNGASRLSESLSSSSSTSKEALDVYAIFKQRLDATVLWFILCAWMYKIWSKTPPHEWSEQHHWHPLYLWFLLCSTHLATVSFSAAYLSQAESIVQKSSVPSWAWSSPGSTTTFDTEKGKDSGVESAAAAAVAALGSTRRLSHVSVFLHQLSNFFFVCIVASSQWRRQQQLPSYSPTLSTMPTALLSSGMETNQHYDYNPHGLDDHPTSPLMPVASPPTAMMIEMKSLSEGSTRTSPKTIGKDELQGAFCPPSLGS